MYNVKLINKPILEPYGDERWRLVRDFCVQVDCLPFTVPRGFITDGASIPRLLWRLCGHPMSTKRLPVAVFHDWLYYGEMSLGRADADEIYRDGLIALGFPRWKANIEYYALRLFGGSHWKGEKPMKKLMIVLFAAVLGGVVGCKSIDVERHGQALATYADTNGVVHVALDASGKPVILDGGWEVSYFQHWTWTKLDMLSATAGPGVKLDINGYESGADSNLVALVKTSFDGAALLAAKVGAAIATAGGSAGVEGVAAMVRQFVSKGGDVSKATVNCANGACTISDGSVTETCTSCFDTD